MLIMTFNYWLKSEAKVTKPAMTHLKPHSTWERQN